MNLRDIQSESMYRTYHVAVMNAMESLYDSSPIHLGRKSSKKASLTNKQKKSRAAAKRAKQARKQNRK
jgi:hypothetical protein